jgi:peptide-methionine (S)-S-oxide reductase
MKSFVLGGGCFWCLDGGYRQLRGVRDVVSGYAGGSAPNPSYEAVCSGTTGHAEVVRVDFDDSVITADQILDVFFTLHDPTQLNRQGADVGTQYRSVMFYEDEQQRELFSAAIERARLAWGDGVVTELSPLPVFYEAEGYHQNFYAKNPNQGYCMAVVAPKVAKVRKGFSHLLIG